MSKKEKARLAKEAMVAGRKEVLDALGPAAVEAAQTIPTANGTPVADDENLADVHELVRELDAAEGQGEAFEEPVVGDEPDETAEPKAVKAAAAPAPVDLKKRAELLAAVKAAAEDSEDPRWATVLQMSDDAIWEIVQDCNVGRGAVTSMSRHLVKQSPSPVGQVASEASAQAATGSHQ